MSYTHPSLQTKSGLDLLVLASLESSAASKPKTNSATKKNIIISKRCRVMNSEPDSRASANGHSSSDTPKPGENIPPKDFHLNILRSRGYESNTIKSELNRVPTEEQVSHYDHALLGAIRENNVRQLSDLMTSGKCMTACNKFSESILHMACRRSTPEVVAFLTAHGASLEAVDDYGRTPLHDACWRAETDFALVTFILDHNSELLRCVDDRGATPLDYVREQQWPEWRDFLRRKADTYWAPKRVRDDSPVTTTASAAFSYEGTQRGGGNDHMPVATPCGESNGNGDNHDGTRARASSNEQEI